MKKLVFLILAVGLIAGFIRGLVSTPSTLELRFRLAEGGPYLTPEPRTYVGVAADGLSKQPTLGNIKLIRPKAGSEGVYEVPHNRRISIFVLSRGVPAFQSTVRVKPRQHLTHDVILNAGIVKVTSELNSRASNENIWFIGPNGQFDINDRFVDGTEFMVPAGEQVFQVGRYLEAKQARIQVIAGHTQNLHILSELGSLSVDLETAIPFGKLSPTPVLNAEKGGMILRFRGSDFDGGWWQFGTYEATLELSEKFGFPIRPATIGPLTITINQPENSTTIPLPLMGVDVQFAGWDETMPKYATALVLSVNDPGLPFATYRVTDNRAPLIFIPPKDLHDYAIALVANNEVLALQTVGSVPVDSFKNVAVAPGGDANLCAEIVPDLDCNSLSR